MRKMKLYLYHSADSVSTLDIEIAKGNSPFSSFLPYIVLPSVSFGKLFGSSADETPKVVARPCSRSLRYVSRQDHNLRP